MALPLCVRRGRLWRTADYRMHPSIPIIATRTGTFPVVLPEAVAVIRVGSCAATGGEPGDHRRPNHRHRCDRDCKIERAPYIITRSTMERRWSDVSLS